MSAVGAAEIMQAGFEAVQWNGELARHKAGEQMRINRQYQQADAVQAQAQAKAEAGEQWYLETARTNIR
jgi:hypothetical protein